MTTDNPDSIATSASLLGRLRNWEDAQSWEEFTRIYWKLIYGVARQAGLPDEEARDIVQETLLGVAKNIRDFQSGPDRGSFKNWMLNVTRWRIADYYRSRLPLQDPRGGQPSGDERTSTTERVADPAHLEAFWEEEWKKSILDAALARLRRRVNPKHAQIFDLYAIRGWPAAKVAGDLGVNIVQVYLINHRLTRLLKEEVNYVTTKLE